jgi:ethanolamine-phosphate cytidylyltransferase
MMHYGHANALRQAKAMGDYLVVGVHSDAEITKNKGIPVATEEERYVAVAACKWVDEVVRDAPYTTDLAIMDKYDCDICVHGDDITTTADGRDSYQAVKDAGRFVECKRTPSVSTTELVGRMLLMTKTHHEHADEAEAKRARIDSFAVGADAKSPYTSVAQMLPTTRRIVQFSSCKEPQPADKVIYVDGTFDLFHAGHVELLRKAKEMGDFLLVGIHDDRTANEVKGSNYPIMNLHERVLSVLACRYVDEVVIGAPYSVTRELLEASGFKISLVVHGKTTVDPDINAKDPYAYPRQLGIYREVETNFSHLTTQTIVDRIISRRQAYEERNRKKQAKEVAEVESRNREQQKIL